MPEEVGIRWFVRADAALAAHGGARPKGPSPVAEVRSGIACHGGHDGRVPNQKEMRHCRQKAGPTSSTRLSAADAWDPCIHHPRGTIDDYCAGFRWR